MQAPGENLIIKLWDSLVDRGIGSLLQPWQTRRLGRAVADVKAEELLTVASARRLAAAIERGDPTVEWPSQLMLNHKATEQEPPWHSAVVNPAASVVGQQLRREANIAAAILCAEDTLEDDGSPVNDAPIDDDWWSIWKENAGRMSATEVQNLWGRILAGEIKEPGSYSLRAMEFLRSVDHREATLIGMVAPFVIQGSIFRNQEVLLEAAGVGFQQLLALQDIGIISGVEALGLHVTRDSRNPSRFVDAIAGRTLGLQIAGPDPASMLKFPAYNVTSLGAEILQLSDENTNRESLVALAEHFKSQGFDVQIADAEHRAAGKFVLRNIQSL